MTIWSGRFDGELDKLAWQLNSSLSVDKYMAEEDIDVSQAWAEALFQAKHLELNEHSAIKEGLAFIKEEIRNDSFKYLPSDEDIHTAVERRLTELIGQVARKLHMGRSRNDQVSTDFRLWLINHIPEILSELRDFQTVLIQKAESSDNTIMPGYTHLQRAQPILAAHWWMSHFWPLERDKVRLQNLITSLSVLPLGSGALAGNPLNIDRKMLAQNLGFKQLSQNSLDAVSDRDFVAEFLFCATLLGTHISKLSEQIIIFSSSEFGFITLSDQFSTGSSLMPQKKNPDLFEISRGKAGTLLGLLVGFLSTLKGLPSTYDKDLQEDKELVFRAFKILGLCLPVLTQALATLKENQQSMNSSIDSFMMATDLADFLTTKDIPFRDAHEAAGNAVKLAAQRKVGLDQISLSDYQTIHPLFDQDLYKWLDPQGSINRRNSIGGTSPLAVKEQIAKAKLLIKGEN